MNVRNDASTSDCGLDERVQLFVAADGELRGARGGVVHRCEGRLGLVHTATGAPRRARMHPAERTWR